MSLVKQWNGVEQALDPRWEHAVLSLTVADESHRSRAAALLAPAGPGRHGAALRFHAERAGGGVGPEAIRRMLKRLDDEEIVGTLELVSSVEAAAPAEVAASSLADAWDAALAALPSDWSDLLCEVELTSTDHLEPAALMLAPINPLRRPGPPGYRFRAARAAGYGASTGMVRRCLERLDEAGVPGTVRVLEAMSDSHHVGTQGPVWYLAGKAV
jgi:hypothetical protein